MLGGLLDHWGGGGGYEMGKVCWRIGGCFEMDLSDLPNIWV